MYEPNVFREGDKCSPIGLTFKVFCKKFASKYLAALRAILKNNAFYVRIKNPLFGQQLENRILFITSSDHTEGNKQLNLPIGQTN